MTEPLPGTWQTVSSPLHHALHPHRLWIASVTSEGIVCDDLLTGTTTRLSDVPWTAIDDLAWAGDHLAIASKGATPNLTVLHGEGAGTLLHHALPSTSQPSTLARNLASLDLWISDATAPWQGYAIVVRGDDVVLRGPWTVDRPSHPSLHPDLTGYAVGEHLADKNNVLHVVMDAPPTTQTIPAQVGNRVWRVDWIGPRSVVLRVTPRGSTRPFHCTLVRIDLDAREPIVTGLLAGHWLFAREPMLSPDRLHLVVQRRNVTDRGYVLMAVDLRAQSPEGVVLVTSSPTTTVEHCWLDATTVGVYERPLAQRGACSVTVVDVVTSQRTTYSLPGADERRMLRLVGPSAGRLVFCDVATESRVFVSDRLVER